MIPLIDLNQEKALTTQIKTKVDKIIDSKSYILGKELENFEKEFAKFIGASHAIGVGNGTDALRLALRANNIGQGDKVLTVSLTSPFTAISIIEESAMPVFCDVDEKTWTINVSDCESKMDKKVKAIMPVHIYGNPADMQKIRLFAKKYKLKIIEDACQAHGASINNKKVGNFSDAAGFSFYPTKNLGALGDGGIVITNNKSIANKIRLLRHGGQTKRFWHVFKGTNTRLDEMQAGILSVKLKWLKKHNFARLKLARRYQQSLKDLPIAFQQTGHGSQSANHLFVIRVKDRPKLHKYLIANEVFTDIYYPHPVHTQPSFSSFSKSPLPITELLSKELLAIPLFPTMTPKQQDHVIKKIKDFYTS